MFLEEIGLKHLKELHNDELHLFQFLRNVTFPRVTAGRIEVLVQNESTPSHALHFVSTG